MLHFIRAIKSGNSKVVSRYIARDLVNEVDNTDEGRRFPIHLACDLGHTEIVRLLIENQCDVEVQDMDGCRPIHLACGQGHVDIVAILIEQHCNKEAEDNSRIRSLHYACRNGHAEVAKLLISSICNLEAQTETEQRPIHLACQNGHVEVVKLLIDSECELEAEDYTRRRSIHLACQNGHVEVVKLLIDSKCELEAEDDSDRKPIHLACCKGHVEVVKLLLDNGCDINDKDEIWNTLEYRVSKKERLNFFVSLIEEKPDLFECFSDRDDLLISACEKGQMNIVQIFIDRKHNFNAKKHGQIPLHCACSNGHLGVVRLLLENGCSVELADDNGKLAIHCASEHGHLDIVKLLAGRGCDPNLGDNEGRLAIDWAIEHDSGEIVKYFIMHEADEEKKDKDMRRLMEEACSENCFSVIRTLIENNLDLEIKYKEGCHAIHIACDYGPVDIVRLLLDSGCDLEAEDDYHWRPLHSACYGGDPKVVKLLLDRGCQIDCNDWLDMRPLHLATTFSHPDIINMLFLNGCSLDPIDMYDRTPLQIAIMEKLGQCEEVLNAAIETKRTFLAVKDHRLSFNTDEMNGTRYESIIFLVDTDTGQTLLDITDKENQDIMESINNALIQEKDILSWMRISPFRMAPASYRLLQECLLYRSIVHNSSIGFQVLCTPSLVNGGRILKIETVLNLAIRYGNGMFIERVLRMMMTLDDVAIEELSCVPYEWRTIPQISARKDYVKLKELEGYNRLHIAVLDDEPIVVEYIMENRLVDPVDGANAVGTPLSLSYALGDIQCRDILQRYKVNSNTVDKWGRSPLQIAIENHLHENCDYLVDNLDPHFTLDNMGMTVMDRAVIAGCENLCRKLLSNGYSCTSPISIIRHLSGFDPDIKMIVPTKPIFPFTMEECAITLCPKIHGSIFQCMMDPLDDHMISICDGDNNTLLHISACLLQPDNCSQIINKGVDCGALNNHGDTAMMKMLKFNLQRRYNDIKMSMIRIVRMLVEKGEDVDKENSSGEWPLEVAVLYNDEELLVALVAKCQKLENTKLAVISQCSRLNFSVFLRRILPLVGIDCLAKLTDATVTNICIDCELMSKAYKLFNNLRREDRDKVVENLIYKSALRGQEKAFDMLIAKEIPIISILSNGHTVLTALILLRKTTFCKKVIDSPNGYRFVNKRNRFGKSALQLAIEAGLNELIEGVMFHVEDVNDPDLKGETVLSLLCKKLSTDSDVPPSPSDKELILAHIKTLILLSGDIYKTGPSGQSAIEHCLDTNTRACIELFFLQNKKRNERQKQQK